MIQAWDLKQRELVRVLAGHRDAVTSLALSLNGMVLISGSLDSTVRLWDLQTVRINQPDSRVCSRLDFK
jgi:WD40 repeat protein